MLQQLILYYNTLKYLKPVQIFGRIYAIIKNKVHLYRIPSPPSKSETGFATKTQWLHHDPFNNSEDIRKNIFTFHNRKIRMGKSINWEPDASLIWKFNLHYFNYLHLLDRSEQKEICLDWINKNPVGEGTGWHPYTLSLRIVNWIKADLQIDEINNSLFTQAAYLYRLNEFYHPGNHYIENGKALIFAGLYFQQKGEATKWFRKGIRIFKKHLPVQVNGDGGYFEPSISYHAIILNGILDIINIIDEENENLFIPTAEKMVSFLYTMTQPDNEITLFNDSALNYAPKTADLVFYAEDMNLNAKLVKPSEGKISLTDFNSTGFAVVASDKIYFALDYGGVRPQYMPAHVHPGVFNYELSVENIRFVVDSGTGSYENDDIRNFVRKSLAHNTLTIDNLEQAEAWGTFRMGKRFPPMDLKLEENSNEIKFSGIFDGYSELIGDDLVFKRNIVANKNKVEISDEVQGNGNHKVKSFVHFHPDVLIAKNENSYLLDAGAAKVILNITEGTGEIHDSSYYPDFGVKMKNKVLVISRDNIPGKISYNFIF